MKILWTIWKDIDFVWLEIQTVFVHSKSAKID